MTPQAENRSIEEADMNDDRYIFVSLSEPVAWWLGITLGVFLVIQIILRRDAAGKSPELRHIMGWIFLCGATILLVNAIVVFNLVAFQLATIGYYPSGFLFGGAVVCASISAIARYAGVRRANDNEGRRMGDGSPGRR